MENERAKICEENKNVCISRSKIDDSNGLRWAPMSFYLAQYKIYYPSGGAQGSLVSSVLDGEGECVNFLYVN